MFNKFISKQKILKYLYIKTLPKIFSMSFVLSILEPLWTMEKRPTKHQFLASQILQESIPHEGLNIYSQ